MGPPTGEGAVFGADGGIVAGGVEEEFVVGEKGVGVTGMGISLGPFFDLGIFGHVPLAFDFGGDGIRCPGAWGVAAFLEAVFAEELLGVVAADGAAGEGFVLVVAGVGLDDVEVRVISAVGEWDGAEGKQDVAFVFLTAEGAEEEGEDAGDAEEDLQGELHGRLLF